ncbi:MAG: FAD-dependent oxidoreductase, partial [Muribaculaceae bacterium]|nr:FAD-dependent oxidoreductase [Muribaculaceae bacterium]
MPTVDNIIIGAGPGGYPLAAGLVARGESTLIIEKNQPGGTCLNRGCIPTKCLCASADVYREAIGAQAMGVDISSVTFNTQAAFARMQQVMQTLRDGVMAELRGVEYINGTATILPDRSVKVGDEIYSAKNRLVIATGSRPATPPIEGIELAMTSDDFLGHPIDGGSYIIIGGGVIGLELASILGSIGSTVTVIEYFPEVLPSFDPEVAKRLRMTMGRRSTTFKLGATVKCIERVDGVLEVKFSDRKGESSVTADHVIVATGRRPVVPDGTLDAGIELDAKGFIKVDDRMRTNIEGVYAIGDVNGLSMLAHSATAQARVILDDDPTRFSGKHVPAVVFTEPEVATVGATPAGLQEAGITFDVHKRQFASNGKALAMGGSNGFVKILTSATDHRILGVSILGPHASDLIAEATIAVVEGLRLQD